MTLASIIAAWAILWVLAAAVVMAAGLRRGRPLPAAPWLITIGAFLAVQEDPLLLVQMASTRPSSTGFRDGVLGLIHAHTRGHMYGGAILAWAAWAWQWSSPMLRCAAARRPRVIGLHEPQRADSMAGRIRWPPG